MDIMDNIMRCKQDDDYLGEVLIVNENLIWHSVHKYIGKPEVIIKNNCIDKDDILQLGRFGFIKSIKAFDVSRGVKFSSFAVTAIVREIRCFLRDSASIIRLTRTANELINKINRIEQELGYLPPISDLAELLNEDKEKITRAIQIGQSVKYLDEPIKAKDPHSSQMTLFDLIDDSEGVEQEVIDRVYVESLLSKVRHALSEKELRVLRHRIDGLNQSQTAVKENISQMSVSRIMKKVAKLLHEQVH
nr:sigma-70 family RNA polymerase sigma factor [Brevibacillus sp. SYP-B805]